MRASFGLAAASMLTATTALANNGTAETVTVTHTSWSTIISTIPCPTPTTVTLCNAQCTTSSSVIASKADIIYQTISAYQAGQVLNIDGTITTLAQATALTLDKTISELVLVPDSVTHDVYTAAVSITNVAYPSSMTGTSGQVVECQTGITTISGDDVVLTDCPCTVQSTILALTATGVGAVPTALVPSTNYIVKIIYVSLIESVVGHVATTITARATSTLTTIQTDTATDTVATTTILAPRPTIVTLDGVTFLLAYDTSYDGIPGASLRKRQASSLPGMPVALTACLYQCAEQVDCVATILDGSTSSCSPLVQFNAQSRTNADGDTFAIVIFRPTVSSSTVLPTSSALRSSAVSGRLSETTSPSGPTSLSSSIRSSPSISHSSSVSQGVSMRSKGSTTETFVTRPGTTDVGLTKGSGSRSSSKSVLYPISNSSSILTTSSLSNRLSSSASQSTTMPLNSFTTLSRPSSLRGSSSASKILPGMNSSTSIASSTNTTSATQVSVALPTQSSVECSSDDPVLDLFNIANYESDANVFCSSYMDIPAVTVTASLTSTAYRVSNITVTLTSSSTITEKLPDATVTDVSTTTETEIDTETVTTTVFTPFNPVKKRYAAPEVATTLPTPFASAIATLPASVLSSACSCIQGRIPLSTRTTTVEQQRTVDGTNTTMTSTVQAMFTTQTQSTVTEASVFTTITTATTTATFTVQTCAANGDACSFDRPDLCCSGACGSGNSFPCGGLDSCCISF